MNFLKNSVTLPVFELEQCSLHINGVELDKDCTGDQILPNLACNQGRNPEC